MIRGEGGVWRGAKLYYIILERPLMYGDVWSFGHVWLFMVMYGNGMSQLVIHGFVEQQMEFWDYRKCGEYRK